MQKTIIQNAHVISPDLDLAGATIVIEGKTITATFADSAKSMTTKGANYTSLDDLKGKMVSEGTTPRQLTDLIGSLCDLTSGSGDKGTPVVLVQGYFDNYTSE